MYIVSNRLPSSNAKIVRVYAYWTRASCLPYVERSSINRRLYFVRVNVRWRQYVSTTGSYDVPVTRDSDARQRCASLCRFSFFTAFLLRVPLPKRVNKNKVSHLVLSWKSLPKLAVRCTLLAILQLLARTFSTEDETPLLTRRSVRHRCVHRSTMVGFVAKRSRK